MEDKTSSDPSIEKILISYAEYERLKAVEANYQKLLKRKEKLFDNTGEVRKNTK
jgi:hypothetical protein